MLNEIHTLLGLSVSMTAVPTPILRCLRDRDPHCSAVKTNGLVSGESLFLAAFFGVPILIDLPLLLKILLCRTFSLFTIIHHTLPLTLTL